METPFAASGAPMILQVAYVVEDIEAALTWWSELLGVPKPDVVEGPRHEIAKTRHLGEYAEVGFTQALFRWRSTQFEFIQPDARPSVWRDWLDEHGPGLHHLGFAVGDFDGARQALIERGLPITQEGEFPKGRYAYADARSAVGSFVEILEVDPEDVRAYGMSV